MGKIARLELKNFTCFANLDLAFSPGINLLIGENGSGKTHLLKALYAACAITLGKDQEKSYGIKLCEVFSPYKNNYRRLVRLASERGEKTRIKITRDDGKKLSEEFSKDKESPLLFFSDMEWNEHILESVYIPSKEMLAHAPGFLSLTARREIAFEGVYEDILKWAYLPKLKKLPNPAYRQLHDKLSRAIGGKIVLKDENFFLKTKRGEIEFSLLAEGIRKLALIWLLIQNGALNPGSILFWDEPEANLNPSLLGLVVGTVLELQRQDVQSILTTHNYVLLKELELQKQKNDCIRYMSLFLNSDSDSVCVETTDDYTFINPNSIAKTFTDLYKRDISRALQEIR
jgi:AAA15 family ATPase/GTPase